MDDKKKFLEEVESNAAEQVVGGINYPPGDLRNNLVEALSEDETQSLTPPAPLTAELITRYFPPN